MSWIGRLLGHRVSVEEKRVARREEGMKVASTIDYVQVVGGIRYSTAKSIPVSATWEYNGYFDVVRVLYRTVNGRWFVYSDSGYVVPLTPTAAQNWLERQRDFGAAERHFGKAIEA